MPEREGRKGSEKEREEGRKKKGGRKKRKRRRRRRRQPQRRREPGTLRGSGRRGCIAGGLPRAEAGPHERGELAGHDLVTM